MFTVQDQDAGCQLERLGNTAARVLDAPICVQ